MNFEDKVTFYSRKDFKAEVCLVAINGDPCSTDGIKYVELIKTHLWANYPIIPKYLYSVFDTTEEPKIGRGFIFHGRYGWGIIIRTGKSAYWNLYPKLEEIPFWELWCRTPSEATAKVIRKSRVWWDKENPHQSTSNNYSHYQTQQPQATKSDCQILGLIHPFDTAQLKKAYRQLCLKYHPDYGGSSDKFRQINEAYNRLKTTVRQARGEG